MVYKRCKFNILALLFLVMIGCSSVQAQLPKLPKKGFNLSFSLLALPGLQFESVGNTALQSGISPSFKLEGSYAKPILLDNHIFLKAGITVLPIRFKYNVMLSDAHPLFLHNGEEKVVDQTLDYGIPSIYFGLDLARFIQFSSKSNWKVSLGVDMNFYPSFISGYGNYYQLENAPKDSSYQLMDIEIKDNSGTNGAFAFGLLGVHASIGHVSKNKKWIVSLQAHYQPAAVGVGTYWFDRGDYKEEGTVKLLNNYLGFQVTRSFMK